MVVGRGDEPAELAANVRHVGQHLPDAKNKTRTRRMITLTEIVAHFDTTEFECFFLYQICFSFNSFFMIHNFMSCIGSDVLH